MTKPLVFISYSHKDDTEKEQLVSQLKVLEKSEHIELWTDDKIEGGATWDEEVKKKITQASVVILLVSANFLTSDYILNEEVPNFLKRRQKEGLTVFPIIAKSCAWDTVDWLVKMNVKPKNGTPIWDGSNIQIVDNKLATITREIKDIVAKKTAPDIRPTNSPNKLSFPSYTSFQQDLEKLIQQATIDFIDIKGNTPKPTANGYISYQSKFSFEYSINNRVWQNNNSWYFNCSFCEPTSLQQAERIFIDRVQEIKSTLANEWKFNEQEQPNAILNKREFEAIKKYNTLRIRMVLAAYDQGNRTQVDFTLEQLASKS